MSWDKARGKGCMGMVKEPGTTLNDIAALAGVSRITVSKVLLGTGGAGVRVSAATRARISKIAEDLHYRPNVAAQMLTGKGSGMIGVLIDSRAPSVYLDCLRHIEEAATEAGYRLMIAQQHENVDSLFAHALDFRAYGAEGIISFAHAYPEHAQEIADFMRVMPRVVYIRRPLLRPAHFVEINIKAGVKVLVEHLYRQGRRRIGIFLADLQRDTLIQRHLGYLQGLAAVGLPVDERLILLNPAFIEENAANAALIFAELVRRRQADAVICQNDLFAAFLLSEARRQGCQIPGELALTGFDDQPFAQTLLPPLTTIRQPMRELARAAVALLQALIRGDGPTHPVTLIPELIVRGST